MGLMLDSSVAIGGERQSLAAVDMLAANRVALGPLEIALSVVTVMELEHGIWRGKDPDRAGVRRQFVKDLIGNIPVYPITTEVARRAGRMDAGQRETRHSNRRCGSADRSLRARTGLRHVRVKYPPFRKNPGTGCEKTVVVEAWNL
jgi:predicted nucleic acid-binding protein